MEFSKEEFLKNASKDLKKKLKDHLDDLDGKEVEFDSDYGQDGCITQYFHGEREYYLYPVYRSWCVS